MFGWEASFLAILSVDCVLLISASAMKLPFSALDA